jgi:hypothetical protein
MASVASSLDRIKSDLRRFLPDSDILAACDRAGHRFRRRVFDPVATVHLFVLQVICFNTAMTHLRHLARRRVNPPAYCRARMRLPLAVLQDLLRRSASAVLATHDPGGQGRSDDGCFYGHRVLLLDGSTAMAPETGDSCRSLGQPRGQKPGCGFAVPQVIALFDAFTGVALQVIGCPLYTREMRTLFNLHPLLAAGDLLLGDRGLCSWVHLALLQSRGCHGCFRLHQRQFVRFDSRSRGTHANSRRMKRLGNNDQLAQWLKPRSRPAWVSSEQYAQLPERLIVRESRYRLIRTGYRTRWVFIVSTLLDPMIYPHAELTRLYGLRWQVETHFAELKTTLKMRRLKSRTPAGVLKELAVFALVYNLVRAVMLRAAVRQKVEPTRISFVDTLRWLLSARPGEPLPLLLINPRRPGRHEPRAMKDWRESYPKMTLPRARCRALLDDWRGKVK